MAVKFDKTDAENIRKFWNYFKIEMPQELKDCLDKFDKTGTLTKKDTQDLKIAFVSALQEADHPLAKDPVWQEVDETLEKHVYDEAFNRDIEKIINPE